MKAQFSFGLSVLPVQVTEKDIDLGESRSCTNCAIARALNRQLPRFGFVGCHVELVPYACWTKASGLEIYDWNKNLLATLPASELPDDLTEWAMDFDEWSEFKWEYNQDMRSWRESHGRDADRPFRPNPVSFVFNFGNLIHENAQN